MNRLNRLVLLLTLTLAVGACSGIAPAAGGGPDTASQRQDPNLLTSEMIRNYTDARQAVQSMRSQWLRIRAAGSFDSRGAVLVYQDGTRLGGVDLLAGMPTIEIESIRYYDGTAASQRWGLGHENGVIFVTSRVR